MKEKETRGFQSEVKQLLNLMINSLYSNKEIFLRELISNASDAADKLRFRALEQPDLYEGNGELRVRILFDKDKRTITLIDNGIGMQRNEVIDNLGTIAKSGTKAFLNSMSTDNVKDNQLIGQFGVGFYSAFIVAEKVIVSTRAAGTTYDQGVYWESTGEGDYTIASINRPERGTEITLYLRKGEEEFLNELRIKNIISKYSDHISLPIEMLTNINQDTKNKADNNEDKKDVVIGNWETINQANALWTRNKSDISNEEYKNFYRHISHNVNEPLIWSHNRIEGKQDYTCLLYIPADAPWGIWNRDYKYGLKLYVKRVLIMDDAEYFLPNYLRFIKGIIDSNDLPLNISREILQNSRITQSLKSAIIKRILSMIEKLAKNKEKYNSFWKNFGIVIKEGPAEDPSNISIIAKLLRFASTYCNSDQQTVSLDEYISRMLEKQDKIYYISADSYAAAKSSPHIELLQKKGIEVLLLFDRIDGWMMNYLTEFNGKLFQLVSKADLNLDNISQENVAENKEIEKKAWEPFINRVQSYLGNRIKEVRLTNRLTDTPAIVTIESNDMTTQMAKLIVAAGHMKPEIKYIFEINPEHKLVKLAANINDNKIFNEWVELLFDQALFIECGTLEDPNKFVRRINNLLTNITTTT
ncbi:molecular chaperone HtpG [Candidatus Baumannia cicadellinicola]|uniref:Chaperone protein HtpG n=1 Tax=Candidatus Palibaumannia cicadellinicola TaxID=186490 RepID=A0A0K2BJX1_9GAMM|nr:Chaperone protein HtpG [Candidatus Baumannia cicadellinicola]